MKELLSPRDLAAAIGVSESSIKRWVDGGVIRATRTAGGHRRIPAVEAVRFVRDSRSVLLKPEVLGLTDLAALDGGPPARGEEAELLFELLRSGDAERARGLVVSLYLGGRSIAQIVDGPLRLAMARVGELWRHEASGIFQEHRATDLAIQAVNRLRSLLPVRPDAPAAAGGAPSGDRYILPSLAVAAVLDGEGLCAVNLGPHTPVDSLLLALDELHPVLMWLSVSHAESAERLSREVRRLTAELETRRIPLAVGGSQVEALDLPQSELVYVGSSMIELEALVRGLRLAANGSPAARR